MGHRGKKTAKSMPLSRASAHPLVSICQAIHTQKTPASGAPSKKCDQQEPYINQFSRPTVV